MGVREASSERDKMLAGEPYDPLDPELVAGRRRARDLCLALNATREVEEEERRRILRALFAVGGGPAVQNCSASKRWVAV